MLGLVLLFPRNEEVAATFSHLLPAVGKEDSEANEQDPPRADYTKVAPDMAMAEGHVVEILLACNARSARRRSAHTSTCLAALSFSIARTIGDKIWTDAGDMLAMEFVREKSVKSISHGVDPENPGEPRVHLRLDNHISHVDKQDGSGQTRDL